MVGANAVGPGQPDATKTKEIIWQRGAAQRASMGRVNQWPFRDVPGEPVLFMTNSRPFRLTPHLAELAGNRQMLPEKGLSGLARRAALCGPRQPPPPSLL